MRVALDGVFELVQAPQPGRLVGAAVSSVARAQARKRAAPSAVFQFAHAGLSSEPIEGTR